MKVLVVVVVMMAYRYQVRAQAHRGVQTAVSSVRALVGRKKHSNWVI